MNLSNRRQFLAQSSLVSLGAFPAFVSRPLFASQKTHKGRILVVIQLEGGNDGLNTVVPYADENYAKHRSELLIKADAVLKINDRVGLHPAMRAAADMLEDGRLAIVQGVGYPNPNRSHEVSMSIWQTAQMDPLEHQSYGWLGRTMDATQHVAGGSPEMILLGDEAPPVAIRSRRSTSVAMSQLNDLNLAPDARLCLSENSGQENELVKFVRQSAADAQFTANRLVQSTLNEKAALAKYPSTPFSSRLQSIAQLIKYGFTTPIYYAIHSGYDTHSTQLPIHSRLLQELCDALKAFHDDLQTSGFGDQVVSLCFSEFGRRVAENASVGTDHGTAAPLFIAGNNVRSGLLGQNPDLSDLEDGDLKMSIDFREIYASIVSDWLHVDPMKTLGTFEPYPIFRKK